MASSRDSEDGQLLVGKPRRPFDSDFDDFDDSSSRSNRSSIDDDDDDDDYKKGLRRPSSWTLKRRWLRVLVGVGSLVTVLFLGALFFKWTRHLPLSSSPSPSEGDSSKEAPSTVTPVSSAAVPSATAPLLVPVEAVQQIPPSDYFDLKISAFANSTGDTTATTPAIREYAFNVTRKMGQPDGAFKPMLFVNGQSPGPLIEANTGDTIRIVVYNGLTADDEPVTIHWHGIDQRNSTWMDGVFGVTQCGIPSGESFTYEFRVDGQRGTFWYHSHVTGQYTDGLYGPIIIHDTDERVPEVDEDRVIMVADLHHQTQKSLLDAYLGRGQDGQKLRKRHQAMAGMEPSPDNIILNGRNVFSCDTKAAREVKRLPGGEYTWAQCQRGSVYSTTVRSGQKMRLRLISHSSNIPIWFSVDGHVLQIVEIDSVEVQPISTTRVFINPGQRYSVILTASQDKGNYLMRATAVRQCSMVHFNDHLDTVNNETTGILSYDDTDPTASPLGEPWALDSTSHADFGAEPWADRKCQDMPFDLAKPMRAADIFSVDDENQHHIPFEMKRTGNALLTFVGGTSFSVDPQDAVLWKAANADDATPETTDPVFPHWHFPKNQHVFVAHNETQGTQIAISALNMMTHPWHLHGQTFQIVGWGPGVFGTGTTSWNRDNPLRRDTVTLLGNTHVVLRIEGTNPGIWPLHCHIQWHAEGGMFALIGQHLNALEQLVGTIDSQNNIPHRFCSATPA